jgi:TrmH family RNA methyltransferase
MRAPSKALEKRIRQLRQKKFRDRENMFVAEGDKLIKQLVDLECEIVECLSIQPIPNVESQFIDAKELKAISSLEHPSNSLAQFKKPVKFPRKKNNLEIYLEDIQDPGNMGTILRTAAWFGHSRIFLSKHCADPFSSKVVQASMGAIAALEIRRESLETCLSEWRDEERKVAVAEMDGENYKAFNKLTAMGIIIGNEGQGISNFAQEAADFPISIEPSNANQMESLNAAVATCILMAHWA